MELLTERHFAALSSRWIDAELARQAGIYSVNSADGAQMIGRNGGGDYSGIAIPFFRPGTTHPREYCLRRDVPDMEYKADGNVREKQKYLFPPGRGNILFNPPGIEASWLQNTSLPASIIEGPLKTLALSRLALHNSTSARWLSIGMNGCWGWSGTIGKTTGKNGDRRDVKGVISDIDAVAWTTRTTYLVGDTNVETNRLVAAGWDRLGRELEGRGALIFLVRIPQETGINGLDDFLARYGPEAALALFEAAKPRSTAKDFHFTDLGNAQRLIARHGHDLLLVTDWKTWCVWDGFRWKRDDLLEVHNLAKDTVRDLYTEAAKIANEKERMRVAGFAIASESAQKIRAMIDLARSDVAARAEDFDADPDLLNFQNGTLHLPSGELRPHDRENRITKLIHYNYNPHAQCPIFIAFLKEIMNSGLDPKRAARLIDYLQVAFGYAATGRTSSKAVFILYGVGDNGKTTLLTLIRELLTEYSVVLQVDSLMERRFESNNAQADLADLKGARFAMTSETEDGQRLSAARLKRITQGMGKIRAVRKFENPISFSESHKLFCDANHKPKIRDDGNAIWNRLHLIPFPVVIPKAQQNRDLLKALLAEAEGILGWIVDGARRWYKDGLKKPHEVEAATDEWRRESDVLEAFFSECCVREKNATVTKDRLYEVYRQWAEKSGEQACTKLAFGKKLLDRRFEEDRNGNSRFWCGLGLLHDANDTSDS
jgi:putative DNA primase/helicase